MSSLTEVTQALLEQNKTLRGVETGISALVKEQVAERVMSERQKLRNEEARREGQRRTVGSPTSVTQGIKQGAKEGLGLGLLGGVAGFLTSAIGSIIPSIGVGGLAAAGAALATKFLVRGAMVGLLAKFGQDVLEGLINKLDPNQVFLDKDAQSKFATGLNFSLMGGLIAKTVGSLFGKRFGRLFGVAGLIGGFLYPYFNNMIDDTKLEKAFNEKFDIDFGADIIAGVGSLIAGTLATVLSGRLLNMIRMKLGIAPESTGPSTRGKGGGLRLGGRAPAGVGFVPGGLGVAPGGGFAPGYGGFADDAARQRFASKVQKMSSKQLTKLGFSRTTTGAITKGNKFASLQQVNEAYEAGKAAKLAKYMKALKLLGVLGLAAEAAMIANMVYQGAPDEQIQTELAGLLGGAIAGGAGAYIGAAVGSVIVPGVGTIAGGAILGLAGVFGGEWVAETLAAGLIDAKAPTLTSAQLANYTADAERAQMAGYGKFTATGLGGVTVSTKPDFNAGYYARQRAAELSNRAMSTGRLSRGGDQIINIGQVGDNVQSSTTQAARAVAAAPLGSAVNTSLMQKRAMQGGNMFMMGSPLLHLLN